MRILKVNTIAGIDKYPRDYRKIIILLNNNYGLITHLYINSNFLETPNTQVFLHLFNNY